MPSLIAEVIAIGDELTSGFRLDTNSQWLSQRLGDLGITVLYHSTVGDDFQANVDVFSVAAARADIVICTGGLGPTADDLTRQSMAAMAGVELVLHEDQLEHLKSFFAGRGRKMTPSNEIQAHFPVGAEVIPNPEGTAPGIELTVNQKDRACTFFALPGVPAEMKQMFALTVNDRLRSMTGQTMVMHHHVARCFGSGESHIESLLPDLVKRGRDPLVGITASGGTISLRLTTMAETVDDCLSKMQPTIATIQEILGDLVFGFDDDLLESVVVRILEEKRLTIAIEDFGLHGDVAALLSKSGGSARSIGCGGNSEAVTEEAALVQAARSVRDRFERDLGLAIGPLQKQEETGGQEFRVALVDEHNGEWGDVYSYGGHSSTRQIIACKRVLNFLRLHLKNR